MSLSFLFKIFFKPRQKQTILLYPKGEHHHLTHIFQEINMEYFGGKLDLHITWFNRRASDAPTRIVLGSYHGKRRLIRINSYLDQAHIPGYFVSYIVYHEILHHLYPPLKGKRGKRRIHHPIFKENEKKFKYYEAAQEFRLIIRKSLFGDR